MNEYLIINGTIITLGDPNRIIPVSEVTKSITLSKDKLEIPIDDCIFDILLITYY